MSDKKDPPPPPPEQPSDTGKKDIGGGLITR